MSLELMQTPAPASTLSFPPTRLPRMLLQRDRFKILLRQFIIRFSNRPANCQRLQTFLNQLFSA